MPLTITSPAFKHCMPMAASYTCEGQDISAPLMWDGLPDGTRSMALVVDDPDAPDPAAPKMIYVHWVLYNLPPDLMGLPEGVLLENQPTGVLEGLNDWQRPCYGGPCPPIGRHRYFFKLFTLDTALGDLQRPTQDQLMGAMEAHVIEKANIEPISKNGFWFKM